MATREAEYRGYKIEVERNGAGWCIWVNPLQADLPIMQTSSFHSLSANDSQAIAEAVQRIDQLLTQ
jgi:hypothetical protein